MNKARFVYFFPKTGVAILCWHRDDLSVGNLLFTCPEEWAPRNQAEFEQAARYYEVKNPQAMKYDADEVPF